MNFIKTHIILFLVVLSFKLSAQPWWFKNPPTSSSGNYYYYSIEADSIQEAKVKAFIAASAIYGELETSNNTIEETVIIQDGVAKDYTKIKGLVTLGGEKIRYKIIEQKNRKGKLYLLFMFGPKTDKLLPKGRHFSVPLATGLSLAVPGLGQIYKKEGIKGVLLITSFVSGMGVGIWSEIQKGQAVKNFNSATTFNQREQFKSDAYKFRNIRNIGIGIGLSTYVINFIDVLTAKGHRFASNDNKEKKLYINIAYNNTCSMPTANLSLRF